MTRIVSLFLFSALIALFCAGCKTASPGFRNLRDSEVTLHEPTGLSFPRQVGPFHLSFAEQKIDDSKTIMVGYGHIRKGSPHMVIITVSPSRLSPPETIRLQKEAFMAAHKDAIVAKPFEDGSQALFSGWPSVAFDYHGFVGDFPPSMRHQPLRMFFAARAYNGHSVLLETLPYDKSFEAKFLPAVDSLVHELFPDSR